MTLIREKHKYGYDISKKLKIQVKIRFVRGKTSTTRKELNENISGAVLTISNISHSLKRPLNKLCKVL